MKECPRTYIILYIIHNIMIDLDYKLCKILDASHGPIPNKERGSFPFVKPYGPTNYSEELIITISIGFLRRLEFLSLILSDGHFIRDLSVITRA